MHWCRDKTHVTGFAESLWRQSCSLTLFRLIQFTPPSTAHVETDEHLVT